MTVASTAPDSAGDASAVGAFARLERRVRPGLLPPLVGVLLTLPSFVWVAIDRSIWPWDPAWYGEVSIDLWATLRTDRGHWWSAMAHAFGTKPPAVAWVGQFFVPLDGLFGSVEAALLFSLVLTQAAAVVLLFVAGRRLTGGRTLAPLVGAVFTAGAPLFVALSHEYFVEPIQTLSVVWVLFVMASARRWHPSLTVTQLIAAVSLGLLAKLATPLYVAVPALVALLLSVLGSRGRPHPGWWREPRLVLTVPVAAALAFGAAEWYDLNFHAAWQQARFSAHSTLYGTKRPFFSQLDHWLPRFGDALFLPYFDIALGALLAGGVLLFALKRSTQRLPSRETVLALLGCAAVPVVALGSLSAQVNAEDRFLLPTIPAVGLALVVVLRILGARIVSALALALFAGQFAFTTLQSFDPATPRQLAFYRFTKPASKPPFAAALERVVRLTCTPQVTAINMVGAEYSWLNHNTLELMAHARFFESGTHCYYTSLGDPGLGWRRLLEFGSPFYVTIDYGNPRNPLPPAFRGQVKQDVLNSENRSVLHRALRSGRYTILPGSRRSGLVVLRLANPSAS